MNKQYVLYNLKEALEQLTKTVNQLETNYGYEFGDYIVDMEHLYHHINTAWNSRDSSDRESLECSDLNFNKWRQFPIDLNMKQ